MSKSRLVVAIVAALLLASPAFAKRITTDAGVMCPAAPSGWTAAPQNPVVWGPTQNPGQESEKVTCTYSDAGKVENVVSMFALPVDPNPFNDFNYGCSQSLNEDWNAGTRIYIVSSTKAWAYAEFDDSANQLSDGDVGPFESVAKELLKNSEPSGHTCRITTTQTAAVSSWYFSFEYAELSKGMTVFGGVASSIPQNSQTPAGSFSVATNAKGTSELEKVVSVHVPTIPMTVVEDGKKHQIVLRITKGINFYLDTPTERLRAHLVVSSSDVPACKRGTKGTLVFTTKQIFAHEVGTASMKLNICGKFFSTGKQVVSGKIING